MRRPGRPWWVALGLWGLPVRAAALAFFWFSIGLAVLSVPAGFLFPPAWIGTLFAFSALWYWLAIRWVDRYDTWD